MTPSNTTDTETDRGPTYRCKNGNCGLVEPRTTVTESPRKTLYRCPGCSRILNIDWHEDD